MTTLLKGAIIGMILGDSCIKRPDKQYAHMELSGTSRDYMFFKKSLLEELTEVKIREDIAIAGYNKKPLYTVRTLAHPVYQKFGMHAYHNGKRCVDEFMMKSLSSLGILIWYLDDGCWVDEHQIRIYSNAYSYAEHLLMAKILNDKHGLRFNIHQAWNKYRMKRYIHFRLKTSDNDKFYKDIVEPYLNKIPEDMKYKVLNMESQKGKI